VAGVIQDRYRMTSITERQLRMAITEPAKTAGSQVDDDLVKVLLTEVRTGRPRVSRAGVLPSAPPGPLVPGPLAVAFQFTVRQGCTVQVKPGADASIVVVIKFGHSAYMPPRHERTWTREDLSLDPPVN
jgi:hypothetical protein